MVHQRPDGTPATVIRLALMLDQHRLTVDELLAALVDEYVSLHEPTPNAAGLEALFTELGAARTRRSHVREGSTRVQRDGRLRAGCRRSTTPLLT